MRRGIASSGGLGGGIIFSANSALLNGSSQYYQSPINTSAAFTVSAVVNLDGATGDIYTIFSEHHTTTTSLKRFSLRYQVDITTLFFDTFAGGTLVRDAMVMAVSGWNLFSITYTSGTAELYQNGTLISTLSVAMNAPSTQPLFFGRFNAVTAQLLDGSMSMLSLYTRNLSAAECLELANLDTGVPVLKCHDDLSAGLKSNLIGFWNLGNTAGAQLPVGDELVDQSGNLNTMGATGSPTYTDQGLTVECS